MTDNLVELRDLRVRFHGQRNVYAVNGIDLDLKAGETLGILGESGSGKSVTLKTLLRLLPENRTQISGDVRVAGQDVNALQGRALANHRGGVASMIFQDPMLALDPVYTIGEQIAEAVMRHEGASRTQGRARALDMLTRVRIPSPERRLSAYPHEMSGGMRQRAMIALALACRPKLLLADEPTTALDATVQIQILILLRELQAEFGMGMIFVTHDIGVAVEVSDRIAVMYAGHVSAARRALRACVAKCRGSNARLTKRLVERIAGAAYGADRVWFVTPAERLAQAPDMDVHRAFIDLR
jgi:peptide/nickel transport system ATP-binding protein